MLIWCLFGGSGFCAYVMVLHCVCVVGLDELVAGFVIGGYLFTVSWVWWIWFAGAEVFLFVVLDFVVCVWFDCVTA